MPSVGKKRGGRGGSSSSKTIPHSKQHVGELSDVPSTSQGRGITSAVLRGRTTTTRAAASNGPQRPRLHGIICAHTAKAMQENAQDAFKEALELFVIPSSKCLIPW
ncbi:hypothetical protein BV898_19743, partial [Hypsibius exemplaris]